MRLRFQPEKQTTQIRIFPKKKSLLDALKKKRVALVWDEGVGLPDGFPGAFALPGGEAVKQWQSVKAILAWLHGLGHERKNVVAAVGGGAVCDLVGLSSALYRRGAPLILVPTTLLAQVDAALGGKTAVDAESGHKNFAGVFYPASEVWLCPEFLVSLNERERCSGLGELLKILWIAGVRPDVLVLREWIETGRVSKELWALVLKGVAAKIKIVERDPLDTKRVREVLNFGHTVGHALEALGDGAVSHGEAVAWGMAVEAGLLRKAAGVEMRAYMESLGFSFPAFAREYSLTDWLGVLGADKKIRGGKVEMSVLDPLRGRSVKKLVKAPRAVAESAVRFFES